MGLTEEQIFDLSLELSDALGKAFTDEESLGLMVKRSLKIPLNMIKQNAQSYEATVDKVVDHAKSNGKFLDLVIGALQRNPSNPQLRKFSQDKLQELLLVGGSNLLSDDLLASLIKALKPISGTEEFEKIVLPAFTKTLPDIDIDSDASKLRESLCNDNPSDPSKWLILLDFFLNKWARNSSNDQLYIVMFVQNLKLEVHGSIQTDLTQWLNRLPESIRPASHVPEQKIYLERPSDEVLKKLQAYFLIIVEPLEIPHSIRNLNPDKYVINGYVITRLGNEDRYTKIESISLQAVLSKETNNSLQEDPYYTLEQIKHEFPEWLVQATEWIGIRCRTIEQNYNLEFILSPLLTVEFWLPFEHLSAATEAWEIYGLPHRRRRLTRILGKEYSVLVRSYDRLNDQESFDKLNRNWQVLISHSQNSVNVSSPLVNSFHLDCSINREELRRQLNQPCLSLSLTFPLCDQDYESQREDLFEWILDEGIPLVVWSRSVDLTNEQKTALKQRMQGMLTAKTFDQLENLFETIRVSRTVDTEERLAFWCDEPKQLIELKKFREKIPRLG